MLKLLPFTIPWAIRLVAPNGHVVRRSWTMGAEHQAAELAVQLLKDEVGAAAAHVTPI